MVTSLAGCAARVGVALGRPTADTLLVEIVQALALLLPLLAMLAGAGIGALFARRITITEPSLPRLGRLSAAALTWYLRVFVVSVFMFAASAPVVFLLATVFRER